MPEPTNYVVLSVGVPRVMRFDNHTTDTRQVRDPRAGWMKTVQTLIFHVTELDGKPADTQFSIISEALKAAFQPWLEGGKYKNYRFTLIKERGEYTAPRISQVAPVA
jgi:hypothetical protein